MRHEGKECLEHGQRFGETRPWGSGEATSIQRLNSTQRRMTTTPGEGFVRRCSSDNNKKMEGQAMKGSLVSPPSLIEAGHPHLRGSKNEPQRYKLALKFCPYQ